MTLATFEALAKERNSVRESPMGLECWGDGVVATLWRENSAAPWTRSFQHPMMRSFTARWQANR